MWTRKTYNGKVRYCERYTDFYTGKEKDVSITFDKDTAHNRKEAQRILNERIAALRVPDASSITLAQLIDEYRKEQERTVRESTYMRNYYAMESVKEILGGDTIVSRMSARYVRQRFLDSGKKPGTLNGHLTRFQALIRWGYKAELIASPALADKIERFADVPHKVKISEKYLEGDELRAVIDYIKIPLWAMLAEFMALSGLRFGEAAALTRDDIDLEAGVIHINKSYDSINNVVVPAKSESSIDDVVIQPQLADVIRRIIKHTLELEMRYAFRSDLFMHDQYGSHISYFAFNKCFKHATKKIAGKELTTHSLRHSHASLLFEQGFTLDEVSRRLRHADSKITREIYIHVTQKLKEKDAEKLRAVSLF